MLIPILKLVFFGFRKKINSEHPSLAIYIINDFCSFDDGILGHYKTISYSLQRDALFYLYNHLAEC